jgi:hypothetical protein
MFVNLRATENIAGSSTWVVWWVAGNALLWSFAHPFPSLLPLVVGIGQWLLLRRLLTNLPWWWIPITVAVGTVGIWTFMTPTDWQPTGLFDPSRLVVGTLVGLVVGGGQGLLLRRWKSGLAWMFGSGLGTLLLWPVYHGLFERASTLFDNPYTARIVSVGGFGQPTAWSVALWLVQGAVCGAMYSLPLAWVALRAARYERGVGAEERRYERHIAV